MKKLSTAVVTLAATVSLSALAAPLAHADETAPAPCATQQTQLDRAEAKLDALTTKFSARTAKVRQAKRALAAADTAKEHRSAKAALATAKEQKARVARAKKAQVQRVAHAQARLDACLAAPAPATAAQH